MPKEYAVYKGDLFVCIGTVNECADQLGVKPETIRYYTTPAYKRKVQKRNNALNYLTVIKLDG